jgi:hypothetical protein
MAGRSKGIARALALSLRALSAAEASTSSRCGPQLLPGSAFFTAAGNAARASRQLSWARWQSTMDAAAAMKTDQVMYHIEIVTGDVRGAGSTAPAAITLIGEREQAFARCMHPLAWSSHTQCSGHASFWRREACDPGHSTYTCTLPTPADGPTEQHVIGVEDDATGFERGSKRTYLIYARDLGQLKRVNVHQLAPTKSHSGGCRACGGGCSACVGGRGKLVSRC